jgi:hypothetical protein
MVENDLRMLCLLGFDPISSSHHQASNVFSINPEEAYV